MDAIKKLNQNAPALRCCPVSGLAIFQQPAWTDICFGRDLKVSFCQVGDWILWVKSSGYIRCHDVERLKKLTRDVLTKAFCGGGVHVLINDWSELKGISRAARKLYIDYIKNSKQLSGLIIYGVSPIMKMSVNLSKYCNVFKKDIQIVDDYPNAIRIAQKMKTGRQPLSEKSDAALYSLVPFAGKPACKMVTNPDWHLQDQRFSLRFEVLNEYVLHGITSGRLAEEHIGSSIRLQEKITRSMRIYERPYYFVLGLKESTGTGQKSRKLYVNAISELYRKYPFQMVIFYGSSKRLIAGINLARPFVPFRVMVTEDLREALKVIEEDKASRLHPASQAVAGGVPGDGAAADQVKPYVNELLAFLEKINWEEKGMGINGKIDHSHPFRPVFDAVGLIKRELDDLFEKHMREQEEKMKLAFKLEQARKMEEIGTIAGGVAHDLNNVLSGLVGYPELVLMNLPDDSPCRKPLLSIKQSGEKAAAIVRDLLTLARRRVVSTEIINLNQIVIDYLKSPEFKNLKSFHPGIRVKIDLESNLRNIMGSSVHLSKTLMNLVSNAAEAMKDGGEIYISTENLFIDKPISGYDHISTGEYVFLEISDTGIGISGEDLGRIFEPFYTKKKMGRSGTGLGMSVVRGTVKDHQGYIDVQSDRDKGSVFKLFFPVTRAILPCGDSDRPFQDLTGNGETILIIDDIAEQRIITSEMLAVLGYCVESVPDGESAVRYLRNNPCDLVVLDMIMDPGIDGLETYKRIIALYPGQKAIIASGFAYSERIQEAQKLGAGACIQKPYTLKKIGLAVKAELEKDKILS